MITMRLYHRKADAQIVEAVQYNVWEDYFEIIEWMKRCGDTHALANEVTYSTPEIHLQGSSKTACPGDWIIRTTDEEFYVCRVENFEKEYEEIKPELNEEIMSIANATCLGGTIEEEEKINHAEMMYLKGNEYGSMITGALKGVEYDKGILDFNQPRLYGFVNHFEYLSSTNPNAKNRREEIYSYVAGPAVRELGVNRFVELVLGRELR
jgi:hypothetical protein